MEKIKVLHVIDGLHGGGKERQLIELLKGLAVDEHYSLGIITFSVNRHYSETARTLVPFFIELKKRPTRFEPFFTIWKHILEFKPDIIHTWDSLASMYVFFPARFLSIAFIDGSIRDAGIERGWQLWIKRLFIRRSDLALANSRAGLKNYGVDGQVIYNAVDTGRFLQRNESNSVNIIMLASFTPYKDHNTFLKAAITLVTKGLIENVYLPGSGPTLEGYIRALSSYPEKIRRHFHFPGMIKNVEQYLAICRYGVLCSTRRYGEGVSNAILEYMASGCVAIATNVGGTSEIIREGHNGFLVNEKDAEQIVERIELLEKDTGLRNSLIANARNTIEQQFSYDKNLRLLKDTYSNILKIVK